MAKKKKQKKVEYQPLCDAFFELGHLERYLKDCADSEMDIDVPLALFLLHAGMEKIDYFTTKYDLKVSADDLFYIEDFAEFMRRAEGELTKEEQMAKIDAEWAARA